MNYLIITQSKNFLKVLLTGSLFLFIFLVPKSAYAVSFVIIPDHTDIKLGEEIGLDIMLDTQNKSINAVGGLVHFDSSMLNFQSVSTDKSIINSWVDEPKVDGEYIKWSGIIPGGFNGVRSPFYGGARLGAILHISFIASKTGDTEISLKNLEAYANDGNATLESITSQPLTLHIIEGKALPSVTSTTQENIPVGTKIISNTENTSPESAQNNSRNYNIWYIIILSILCFIITLIKQKWRK